MFAEGRKEEKAAVQREGADFSLHVLCPIDQSLFIRRQTAPPYYD